MHLHVYGGVCVFVYMCVYVFVCVCMCVFVYMCVCVYEEGEEGEWEEKAVVLYSIHFKK